MTRVIDVVKAIRHVHSNVEAESQWSRAELGMRDLDALERAQVWNALSSFTLDMDPRKAPVVLSQYKVLYKALMKSITETCSCHGRSHVSATSGDSTSGDEDSGDENKPNRHSTLEKYNQLLRVYQGFIESLQPWMGGSITPPHEMPPADMGRIDVIEKRPGEVSAKPNAVDALNTDKMTNQLNGLAAAVDATAAQIQATLKQQELVTRKLEEHIQTLQTLHTDNNKILSKVDASELVISKLPSLIKPIGDGYSAMDTKLKAVQESVSTMAAETEAWKNQTTEYSKIVADALVMLTEQHKTSWDQLSRNIDEIDHHYTQVETQVDETNRHIAQLWQKLSNGPDAQVDVQASNTTKLDDTATAAPSVATQGIKTGKAAALSIESIDLKIKENDARKTKYSQSEKAFSKNLAISTQDKEQISPAFTQVILAFDSVLNAYNIAKNTIRKTEQDIEKATRIGNTDTASMLTKALKTIKEEQASIISQSESIKTNCIRNLNQLINTLPPNQRPKLQSHYEPFDDLLTSPPTWSACVSPRSESP